MRKDRTEKRDHQYLWHSVITENGQHAVLKGFQLLFTLALLALKAFLLAVIQLFSSDHPPRSRMSPTLGLGSVRDYAAGGGGSSSSSEEGDGPQATPLSMDPQRTTPAPPVGTPSAATGADTAHGNAWLASQFEARPMLMKMPMPAPGSSELPLFNGENATRWLHLYDAMAKDRYLTEGERAARLPDFYNK